MTTHRHTKLSAKEFYGYAALIGLSSSMQLIWSVSDIWVVSERSIAYVAALGLVDAVFVILSGLAYGIIDIHAAQISKAEGQSNFAREYPTLLLSALFSIALSWLPVKLGSLFFMEILTALGQPIEAIMIADSNLQVRADTYILTVLYVIVPLALRVRGYRKLPLALVGVSLLLKLYLNSTIEHVFPQLASIHIEQAVVYTTAMAQVFSISVGLLVLLSSTVHFKTVMIDRRLFNESCRDLLSHAPKIAAWNINDFVSSSIVVLMFGRIGIDFLAAANLASKITSLFYRVPQAFAESAFIFYGYATSSDADERKRTTKVTVLYSILPVLLLSMVVFLCSDILIVSLAPDVGTEVKGIADFIIKTHMIFALFYVLQHVFSQFLVAERQTKFLLAASLISTWFLVVPGVYLINAFGASGEAIVMFERCSIVLMALINVAYLRRFRNGVPNVFASAS